ncbi:DUF333 domain-containing protein [Candidatus Curtissbacteria bacterium]|nr:DUF333 domain-containing protein [Candidatus Curtissbacteria bacterium]
MLLKKGYVQNLFIVFVIFIITVPTMWYLLNRANLHDFNSFAPPDVYQQASPTPTMGLANPASVYCTKHRGRLDLFTNSDGSEAGNCVFKDGTVCDEWAYFRNECKPRDNLQQTQ